VAFSTVYLAFQSRIEFVSPPAEPDDSTNPLETSIALIRSFVLWTNATVKSRRYWLRASVLSLALAVPALAAPFITTEVATPTSSAHLKAWPTPPPDGRTARALYRAQVAEVAALRADERAKPGEGKQASTQPKLTEWPAPPKESDAAGTRYRAEVAEVAAQRTKQLAAGPQREGHDEEWAWTFAITWLVLMLILAVASLLRGDPDPNAEANVCQMPTTTLAQ
jgi:hypothetical protein